MSLLLLTAPGGPLPIQVVVSLLFLLTLGVFGFASSLFLAIPFTVEADEEGCTYTAGVSCASICHGRT